MNEVFTKLIECHKRVEAARRALNATTNGNGAENQRSRSLGAAGAHCLPSGSLTTALADRGILQTDLGLASAGLKDLLNAYFHEKFPDDQVLSSSDTNLDELLVKYLKFVDGRKDDEARFSYSWLEARLGETLRVYARDVLLSERITTQGELLRQTIEASIRCFERAESGATSDNLPWVRAHGAAALTMKYWTCLAAGETSCEKIAEQAERLFLLAIPGYGEKNPWCKRFYAFLRALRGGQGDFREATELLAQCAGAVPYHDSTIDRHQAMLLYYDTQDPNPEVARRAGFASLDKGLQAVKADSEDYIASAFSTYSLFSLAYYGKPANQEEADEQEVFKQALPGALEAARVRSINTISQAYATLLDLALIQAITAPTQAVFEQALKEARKSLSELEARADLETRCMFIRSMIWQLIERYGGIRQDEDNNYARLFSTLQESFQAVRNPLQAKKENTDAGTVSTTGAASN